MGKGNRCERNRFFITRRKINPVRLRLSAWASEMEKSIRIAFSVWMKQWAKRKKDLHERKREWTNECVCIISLNIHEFILSSSVTLKCIAVGVQWIFQWKGTWPNKSLASECFASQNPPRNVLYKRLPIAK